MGSSIPDCVVVARSFRTVVFSAWLVAAAGQILAQPEPAAVDPLAERGYVVTGGAAPGYVEDRVCGSCHADLYRSYQDVGMARSFYRPRPEDLVEDFTSGYHHEPSRRHYQMIRRDGGLVMQRYQLDVDGERINEVEQTVDWILGSGNHSRTYLFRTPSDELYQLPLAWYSQTQSWGMAPGFDRPDHLGLLRRVRRECMFCHNAYPDVPAGSDTYASPHVYPEVLPEGVGCQRCHGPGAEHSRAAMREEVDFEQLYATIVNPSDLAPRLRDDVCYQCHMQPSVAVPGKRRFGRQDYSFRPGEPLSDYLIEVDIVEAGQDRSERFEINHHPYRLEQSQCFSASEGAMSCLTCHDPHQKVAEAQRAAHYRDACFSCHEIDACGLEDMAGDATLAKSTVASDDCAGCHMPKRRPQDVVNVVMTDHRIRRRPGGPELLAPMAEREPEVDDVVLMHPKRAPKGALGELYRAYAVAEFSNGGHATAVKRLEQLIPEVRPQGLEPSFALARGQLKQQRPRAAEQTLKEILKRSPDYPTARELLGVAYGALDQRELAVAQILEAIDGGQDRPEARSNLGILLIQSDRPAEALLHLERAVEWRPNMSDAWFYLGVAQAELGRLGAAADSLRCALALEPASSRAYLALGRILLQQDRRAEALRYLRHGTEHAKQPGLIAKALAGIVRVEGATK